MSLLCLLASGSLAATALGQCPPSLDFGVTLPVGFLPLSATSGDFNGDGRLDLAVANQGTDDISILLGNGDGTFHQEIIYAVGFEPYFIVAADFNADGWPDVATANHGSNTVSVLLGNGNGFFQSPVNYPVGNGPIGIAAADFDLDGRLDLAVANQYSASVSVLIGRVAGGFQPATVYAVGNGPSGVAAADFNSDGRPDLAVTNFDDNTVSVLRAFTFTPGTFQPAIAYPVGTGPRAVAAADLNGDGRPDLATANYGGGTVSILLANGAPSPGTFPAALNYNTGAGPHSVAIVDMNADGRPEVVVASGTADSVSVLSESTPRFGTSVVTTSSWAAASSPTCVVPGDFSNDGRQDIAVCCAASDTVRMLTGHATNPIITQQPVGVACASGQTAAFTVAVSGNSGTYQWRKDGLPLVNGGRFSGVNTSTLTISPSSLTDNASALDVVFTNACGTVISKAVGFAVTASCSADFNRSGTVSVQDIFDFLSAYFAGCP